MIAPKALHGAAAAAAIVAVTLALVPSAEARCAERQYVGEAYGLLRGTAGIGARSDWRSQVRRRLGNDFAYWSRARSRITRCSRREGERWFCRASARPCND